MILNRCSSQNQDDLFAFHVLLNALTMLSAQCSVLSAYPVVPPFSLVRVASLLGPTLGVIVLEAVLNVNCAI